MEHGLAGVGAHAEQVELELGLDHPIRGRQEAFHPEFGLPDAERGHAVLSAPRIDPDRRAVHGDLGRPEGRLPGRIHLLGIVDRVDLRLSVQLHAGPFRPRHSFDGLFVGSNDRRIERDRQNRGRLYGQRRLPPGRRRLGKRALCALRFLRLQGLDAFLQTLDGFGSGFELSLEIGQLVGFRYGRRRRNERCGQ